MNPPVLQLLPGQPHRVLRGHPWVYSTELAEMPANQWDGHALALRDPKGRPLGVGLYNSRSKIAWRRFSREECPCDRVFLERTLRAACERRAPEACRRLVWSEADNLPGLVVDQYEDVLVVQVLTKGMDDHLPIIADILKEGLSPAEIVFRNDAPVREFEGLARTVSTLTGKDLAPRWYRIGGIDYHLDLQRGHKTGFYLDQRLQHPLVGGLAAGRRVLDCFCNQGAFALHCARNGASEVTAVDSSAEALAGARQNAARAGLAASFVEANVFDYFTEKRAEKFGLIILDPPSFARNKASLEGALRGYKELNLRALRMLEPGGLLATYSCSQHCDRPTFMRMLADAAADVGRPVQVVCETGQPQDHPVLINMPESEYLKGAILRVL